jgi:tetratricopeptide (TPR) repeat protein
MLVMAIGAASVALLRFVLRDPLASTAAELDYRITEARLAGTFEHRPLRRTGDAPQLSVTAVELHRRWRTQSSPETGQRAGKAFLLAGAADRATTILREVLHESTGEADTLAAIQKSHDAALLTDYSAAGLEASATNNDARRLLLALEAADRAWKLDRSPAAAWNRAVAADRLGIPSPAARAWKEAIEADPSSGWTGEATRRRALAERRLSAIPVQSHDGFFYRELVQRAIDSFDTDARNETSELRRIDPAAGDHLASDTAAALSSLSDTERMRAASALASYQRGRRAFESERYAEARDAYASAEREFAALRLPLELLARDQRIRCECSQADVHCLDNLRRFRSQLVDLGRYPWLAARAASAEGQTLFRAGRIYESVEAFQRAQTELRALHDASFETVLHSQLANTFAAAGETELALSHYLAAIRSRSEPVGDRRRKQLEDAMTFTLQHGYLATTELLLDELAASPGTEAARVMEASLRGVLATRRGDADAATRHFDRARALLDAVPDAAARAEVARSLAVAAAGSQRLSTRGLDDIEAAIARQREQNSVWLPLLLVERGVALERKNELARAERDYLRSIEILEAREPRIDATVLSLGVASDRDSAFDRLIRLYLRERKFREALMISQRSAALRISSVYARGAGLRDVYRAARDTASGDSLAELRAAGGDTATVVTYHLLRDELVTWVIQGDDIFIVRRAVRDLARSVERLDVEHLSDLLLRDWIEHVPRETTLLIQPPAEVEAVPFAMLRTRGGEPLLARNASAYAPSFRAFVRAARNDAHRSASVDAYFAAAPRPGGGLNPLPRAAGEVTRAARMHAGAMVDTNASRAHFLERAPNFGIIHFAGHVLANEGQPLLSALVFEDSQMLYVHELDAMAFARARLLVLSACETGRSPRPTMSVANALLSQDVPSVVYTLWPVEDEAAEQFAVAFHRSLSAGASRAEAVRVAQLTLFRDHPDRPQWWAAFAIAGTHVPLTERRRGVAS